MQELAIRWIYLSLVIAVTCSEKSTYLQRNKRSEVFVDLPTFRKQDLECHNNYRKLHGVHSLTLSDKLNKVAQGYAEYLAKNDTGLFHSKIGYGENLYRSRGYIVDGTNACQSYYEEEQFYDYSLEVQQTTQAVGHFTQLVSRASCFMGTGVAKSKTGYIYVVENYDPAGNIRGDFKKNVFPVGGHDKSKLSPYELVLLEPVCTQPDRKTYLRRNLDCHNAIRKMHGVPAVSYSDELNKHAQMHANMMAERGKNMLHPNMPYEYLLLVISGPNPNSGFEMCEYGYEKQEEYNETFYNSLNTRILDYKDSAFIKMTWKSMKTIGYGIGITKNGTVSYHVLVFNITGFNKNNYRNNLFPKTIDTFSTSITSRPPQIGTFSRTTTRFPTTIKAFSPNKYKCDDCDFLELSYFRKRILACHNMYRHTHGVPPLIPFDTLDEIVQRKAELLAQVDHLQDLLFSTSSNYFHIVNSSVSGDYVCHYWYGGIFFYNFQNPPIFDYKEIRSFTNMIWKSHVSIGIGYAKSATGKIYVVTSYNPNEIKIGKFKENVFPPFLNSQFDSKDNGNIKSDCSSFQISPCPNHNVINMQSFLKENLECHNYLRNRHGSPNLIYDHKLIHLAQMYARELALTDQLLNSDDYTFGVNVFVTNKHRLDGRSACKTWYKEFKFYDYNVPRGMVLEAGQFTQMVWKNSSQMGIGLSFSKTGVAYVVCIYYPRGNIPSLYSQNVLHPGSIDSKILNRTSASSPVPFVIKASLCLLGLLHFLIPNT